MTTREAARQHAERVRDLGEQIQHTHDPYQIATLSKDLRTEAEQMRTLAEQAQAEDRTRASST